MKPIYSSGLIGIGGAIIVILVSMLITRGRNPPPPEYAATPGAITYLGAPGHGSVTVLPVTMPDGTKCVAIMSGAGAGIDCDHSTRAP